MCVCVSVCVFVCLYTYLYMHARMHTHRHIHLAARTPDCRHASLVCWRQQLRLRVHIHHFMRQQTSACRHHGVELRAVAVQVFVLAFHDGIEVTLQFAAGPPLCRRCSAERPRFAHEPGLKAVKPQALQSITHTAIDSSRRLPQRRAAEDDPFERQNTLLFTAGEGGPRCTHRAECARQEARDMVAMRPSKARTSLHGVEALNVKVSSRKIVAF